MLFSSIDFEQSQGALTLLLSPVLHDIGESHVSASVNEHTFVAIIGFCTGWPIATCTVNLCCEVAACVMLVIINTIEIKYPEEFNRNQ